MSVEQTSAALAQLQLKDDKLKRDLHKLHQSRQHCFLPWRHLGAAHLSTLAAAQPSERRQIIADILGLEQRFPLGEQSDPPPDSDVTSPLPAPLADPNQLRREILVDFALGVLGFCWSSGFNALKTSTFFSILYCLHQEVAERPGPPPSVQQCWQRFEQLLLQHSLERPPFSIAVFSAPDVSLLARWTLDTYFAQLAHYQFVFGTRHHLILDVTNSAAERVDERKVGVGAASSEQEWNLEYARNYWAHSATEQAGLKDLQAEVLQGGAMDSPAPDSVQAEQWSEQPTAEALSFLQAQSDASDAMLHSALGSARDGATQQGAGALLLDPEEQALFDAAMARGLASLQAEVRTKLAAQQDAFAAKIAELDPSATQAANASGGVSARRLSSAERSRPLRSRGRQ